MEGTEITLAVARALGKELTFYTRAPVSLKLTRHEFDPLHDPRWAVPMMVWLTEHDVETGATTFGAWWEAVDEAPHHYDYDDFPTKADAILRCLCEAVAKVAEHV